MKTSEKLGKALISAAAAEEEKSQAVQELLDLGVDPNFATKYYKYTALMKASRRGHKNIVRILLEAGANPNLAGDGGVTALIFASANCYTDIMSMLLEAGADPNLADDDGTTPLDVASYVGNVGCVDILKILKAEAAFT